jgi:N-succinyldiaminopimelate aminotransferase
VGQDISPIHPVYAAMGTTIFEHMSGLARQLGAINLGQGFPDEQGPPELIEAAACALREKSNQYPPGAGLPELRDAVCAFYRRKQGLEFTREQVIVTSGATEGIADAILALVRHGDEVILFQPAYDAYAPMVRRAGGMPVFVTLRPPEFRYLREDLAAAITGKTRVLILNDPLNPAGTVATASELAMIAEACVAHDLIAICDEVWEDVRFDGNPHRSLMQFPGMAERTIKIGSAGKIFGLTGWKIGWLCAAAPLAAALGRAHQFVTYATAPALQWAVAEGLEKPGDWFAGQRAGWARSRERLAAGLAGAGFAVLPNAATWFLCTDLAASGIALTDAQFSERAVREAGVASIPVSAFYEGDGPRNVLRFCFTKDDATLDQAIKRLATFRQTLV